MSYTGKHRASAGQLSPVDDPPAQNAHRTQVLLPAVLKSDRLENLPIPALPRFLMRPNLGNAPAGRLSLDRMRFLEKPSGGAQLLSPSRPSASKHSTARPIRVNRTYTTEATHGRHSLTPVQLDNHRNKVILDMQQQFEWAIGSAVNYRERAMDKQVVDRMENRSFDDWGVSLTDRASVASNSDADRNIDISKTLPIRLSNAANSKSLGAQVKSPSHSIINFVEPQFRIGDLIHAPSYTTHGRGRRFPAVVARVRVGGAYDVEYDNGGSELGVREGLLTHRSLSPEFSSALSHSNGRIFSEADVGTSISVSSNVHDQGPSKIERLVQHQLPRQQDLMHEDIAPPMPTVDIKGLSSAVDDVGKTVITDVNTWLQITRDHDVEVALGYLPPEKGIEHNSTALRMINGRSLLPDVPTF